MSYRTPPSLPPKAGSVAGGLSYLGLTDDDDWVNHPISCHSTRIPVVCSFVAEAEYAGLYAAARIATEERKILTNMGHPQPVRGQLGRASVMRA